MSKDKNDNQSPQGVRNSTNVSTENENDLNDQGNTTGEDYATRQAKNVKEGGPGLGSEKEEREEND